MYFHCILCFHSRISWTIKQISRNSYTESVKQTIFCYSVVILIILISIFKGDPLLMWPTCLSDTRIWTNSWGYSCSIYKPLLQKESHDSKDKVSKSSTNSSKNNFLLLHATGNCCYGNQFVLNMQIIGFPKIYMFL